MPPEVGLVTERIGQILGCHFNLLLHKSQFDVSQELQEGRQNDIL